jgi:putative heme-binding domain-containing protein
VQTVDGLIHTGMPVPQADPAKVELLLQDATRLAIKKDEIDVMEAAKISVMPEGLLKEFTLQDMADLFAYLETSKQSDAVAEGK